MIKYTFLQTPKMTATFVVVDDTKYVEVNFCGGDSLSVSITEYTASYGFNRHLYMADSQYESFKNNRTGLIGLPQYFETLPKAA
jgi:hypothetical protein